jgi:hypothetical protein
LFSDLLSLLSSFSSVTVSVGAVADDF